MQLTAFLFTPSRFTDYYYSSFASKSLFRSKTTSSVSCSGSIIKVKKFYKLGAKS